MARGSVFKRGRTWTLRYDAGIAADGKRLQPTESGFDTQQAAEARLAQCLHEVASGRYVQQSRETVATFGTYWIETVKPGRVRNSTLHQYAEHLRCYIIPEIGQVRLQALKAGHVHKLYRVMETRGLSSQTIRHVHAHLKQLLKAAVDEQLVVHSIMEHVTQPRLVTAEMQVWTAEELDQFLTLTADELHGAMWHLIAMTGMRRGEALGLRWKDIDLAAGRIHIRQQVASVGPDFAVTELKTRASKRTVVVGPATIGVLTAHRTAQHIVRLQAGKSWVNQDLVFPALGFHAREQPGGPMRPLTATQAWRRRVERTDLPRIRLHDLRHTHATMLLSRGMNIKALAARLGHDPVMLLRTYAHTITSDQAHAVYDLEQHVLGAAERSCAQTVHKSGAEG